MKLETKIGFVGAGAMAQAIAGGLLASGSIEASNILASATSGRFKAWWEERGVTFMVDNNAVIEASDVVFVAVKPHLYSGMFDKYVVCHLLARYKIYFIRLNDERRRHSDKLWVSIMAGVTLSDLNLAINKVGINNNLLTVSKSK